MRYVSSLSACAKAAFIGLGLLGCQADQDVEPAGFSADCLVKASANNGQIIAGSYIVTYKPEALPGANSNARMGVAAEQLLSRYQVADAQVDVLTTGEQSSFLAHLTEAESARLQQDPAV